MPLTKEQTAKIREELESCKKPLIYFHDDPDGLCSFLLFYKFVGDGKGVIIKTTAEMGPVFAKKIEEYAPDKVFVLDKAVVSQGFFDKAAELKAKVIWVDHHFPLKRENVSYFNPRLNKIDDSNCVSRLCYDVVKDNLWIAMVGILGDWGLDLKDDFIKEYPELLPKEIRDPAEALYTTTLGRLVRIFSFILKGKSHDAMKCVKILSRIDDPYELLKGETPRAKFLIRKYEGVNEEYKKLLNDALDKAKTDDKTLTYIYKADRMSLTSDLSNELLYRFPNKVIIIGREKSGEVKLSLRSSKIELPKKIEKALEGLDGYGGGHEYACGVNVKEKDFKVFINRLIKSL
ncbi:hypothetical protein J4209_06755 [Candidatus Woesearchaeota archaeon]|nr:hypothetical protein [Candidatus Woesearchaeota archaeon]